MKKGRLGIFSWFLCFLGFSGVFYLHSASGNEITFKPLEKNILLQSLAKVEDVTDGFRALVGGKKKKDYFIQPYMGFGNNQTIYFSGRVLRDKNLKKASDQDSVWENFKAMLKRFNSREMPNARVIAIVGTQDLEIFTDEEGYFEYNLPINYENLPVEDGWLNVKLRLPDLPSSREEFICRVLIPAESSKIGIISDIDDTVLKTGASNLLQMLKLTLFNNAHTRLPFEGVAALYQAFHAGAGGSEKNPLFYVSSSPWNLYDLLDEFFDLQDIPKGPFFLRDFGIDKDKFIVSGHEEHKIVQIEKILSNYPDMKFILIGDSGEKDPEIFTNVVQAFPERISTIYIRNVSKIERGNSIAELAEGMQGTGIEMLLVKDSEEAAIHAIGKGYIAPESLEKIILEKDKDLEP